MGKIGRLLFFIAFLLVGGASLTSSAPLSHASSPPRRAPAPSMTMTYDLTVAGFRVFKIHFLASFSKDTYRTHMRLSPEGLASLFTRTKTTMASEGTVTSRGSLRPRLLNTTINTRSYRVSWGEGKEKPKTLRSQELPDPERLFELLTTTSFDPATWVLESGLSSSRALCTGKRTVYNGRELFEIHFKKGQQTKGENGRPLLHCQITYVMRAGLSRETILENNKNPPRFDLWIAPFPSNLPYGPVFYKVVEAKGTLFGVGVTFRLRGA